MTSNALAIDLMQEQIAQLQSQPLDENGRQKVVELQKFVDQLTADDGSLAISVQRQKPSPLNRAWQWLKGVKYLGLVVSMLVSIAAFTLVLHDDVLLATGFIFLLLIHELGHVIQLRREGINASIPMFIPFLGAVVIMKEQPDDAAAEARVGLAGPVLGSLAALVPFAVYLITGANFWGLLALLGFYINLWNLIPVSPLDGGRAFSALSPYLWPVGFLMLLGMFIWTRSPLLALITLVAGAEAYGRLRDHWRGQDKNYYKVSIKGKLAIGGIYLALVCALIAGLVACSGVHW